MGRLLWPLALSLLAATGPVGAGDPPADPLCAVLAGACVPPPYMTVMSAFPAELKEVLARAEVTETVAAGARTYYVGTLGGARVVLVRSGIGLVNAQHATEALLDRFEVSAIAFSGVAGSWLEVGDVAVPAEWHEPTAVFPVDASLLAVAQTLASPPVPLERCTPVPPEPPGDIVCLDHTPRIVVGGRGESADPFGGNAFPCVPDGGPVFGCAPLEAALPPDAEDMESGAVARVAGEAGVPFIAFRGVSDSSDDPFAVFFDYYRLAADNAAATTTAFLAAWTATEAGAADRAPERRATSRRQRVGAACDWERAASPACAGMQAPRRVTRRVARACRLGARAAAEPPGSEAAGAAEERARRRWQGALRLLGSAPHPGLAPECREALVAAVGARAAEPSP